MLAAVLALVVSEAGPVVVRKVVDVKGDDEAATEVLKVVLVPTWLVLLPAAVVLVVSCGLVLALVEETEAAMHEV